MEMKCSCCINTYKRPFLLKKLLNSLNNQLLDETVEVEIIVVDNDPEQQAEKIVSQAIDYLKFPVFYFFQPIKNISLTRNMAIKNAKGDFIFFIDDDEYADVNWMSNLLKCMNQYKADLVFGRLIPYFDEFSDNIIVNSGFYQKSCSQTGKSPKNTGTGNCLIRAEILKSIDGPFNPEYGLTGGEDTYLFEILKRKGFKFTTCREAETYEYYSPERTTLNWLLRRGFRTGNAYTRRTIHFSENKISMKLNLAMRAGLSTAFYLLMLMLTFVSKRYFIFWLIKVYQKAGHFAAIFNYYPKDYKNIAVSEFSNIYKKIETKNYQE